MNPNLVFVRSTIYALKRDYGVPVDLYRDLSNTFDAETGVKSINRQKVHLHKCIVVSGDMIRSFSYGHSFLAADRNFAYGAKFDVGTKGFMVDVRDLPVGFTINMDDFCIYQGKRYDFKQVDLSEGGFAYKLLGKEVEGAPISQIHVLNVYNTIRLIQNGGTS